VGRAIDPDVARRTGLAAVGVLWLVAVGWIVLWPWPAGSPPGTVEVVHWANGHLAGDDALLPAFATRFNAAGHRTAAGSRIIVKPYLVNSGQIEQELISRVQGKGGVRRDLPNPVLVTPVAEHWLYDINDTLGAAVVETAEANSLALTWLGIATFKDMAECLGWPGTDLGYDDIVALSADPGGWESRGQCARTAWGRRPRLAYTDPNSSSTGRTVLYTLLSIAAGKPPEQLSVEDAAAERVTTYLRKFQAQVDHYVPDTLLLNCEIAGGPAYGHFFPLAEDNLVKLYEGKLVQTDPSLEPLFPCQRPAEARITNMVMIYPREGAAAHTHPAALVQHEWVSAEQREAAQRWIAFLREDEQQREFMQQGFRPATRLAVGCPICPDHGLQTGGPKARIDPNRVPPAVGQQAVAAWGDVKNTGVVVFVVDTSLSMAGAKLQSAREGVIGAIDQMYERNLVGLVTFSTTIDQKIAPAPLSQNRFLLADALRHTQVSGGSALFDAIAQAMDMAAGAPAPERAIRGVVVLAGGPARSGAGLSDLAKMASGGKQIRTCRGFEGETHCLDQAGQAVDRAKVTGVPSSSDATGGVKVYFIGIGMSDADLEVGRILAEATHSNFVGTTVKDLSTVVGVFKGYF
jgi:hypothetical protein